jgi:hypothetical protein
MSALGRTLQGMSLKCELQWVSGEMLPDLANKRSVARALLLLPFVFGFSTSLVILILNKFIESITVFFGGHRGSDGSS